MTLYTAHNISLQKITVSDLQAFCNFVDGFKSYQKDYRQVKNDAYWRSAYGVSSQAVEVWHPKTGIQSFPVVEVVACREWLLDVSSGFEGSEEVAERGGDQVDDSRESSGVAVTAGASACGLEEAVECFETGIGVA